MPCPLDRECALQVNISMALGSGVGAMETGLRRVITGDLATLPWELSVGLVRIPCWLARVIALVGILGVVKWCTCAMVSNKWTWWT